MASKKRWVIVLAALLVLAALIALQWGRAAAKKENKSPVELNKPVAVKTALVEQGGIKPSLIINGSVAGKREITVTAKAQGTIEQLGFKTGDRVAGGSVLAVIEQTTQQLGVSKAQDQTTATGLALEKARKDYERVNELYRQGAVSKSEFESVENLYKNAQVAYSVALTDSRLAEEMLKNATVLAPFTGSLAEKFVEEGQVVFPGEKIFTLVDDSSLMIKATVSADRINSVFRGQKGVFTTSLFPGKEFQCTVTAVSSKADVQSRAYTVELGLSPDAGQILRPGMFGEVSLETGEVKGTIMPRDAVIAMDETGKADIYVIKDGKSFRKKVLTSQSDIKNIVVTNGINPGERVVVFGQSLLKEGTTVVEGE
ncbi:MAG: efflux RND transporter periplasmic adaptor subunit [Bacillota bacterium]